MLRRAIQLFTLLSVCVLVGGCGLGTSDGPPRHQVKGEVTYAGEPVPFGEIKMEPDTSDGNSGPMIVMPIKDGKYASLPDQGAVSGSIRVIITGQDGASTTMPDGMEMPNGLELFPMYSTTTSIEGNEPITTIDFEVPEQK